MEGRLRMLLDERLRAHLLAGLATVRSKTDDAPENICRAEGCRR